jgi:hypothetical protein
MPWFYRLIVALSLASIATPSVVWWQNPHLTEMQIFQQFWPLYLLSFLAACAAVLIRAER